MPASGPRELPFNGCRAAQEESLLGERGRGYGQFLRTLDNGWVALAAGGTARGGDQRGMHQPTAMSIQLIDFHASVEYLCRDPAPKAISMD